MTVSNLPIYPQLPLELQAIAVNANTDIINPDTNIYELALPANIDADGGQLVSLWAAAAREFDDQRALLLCLDRRRRDQALGTGAAGSG